MVPVIDIDDAASERGELDIPSKYRLSLLLDGHTSVSIFVSQELPSPRNATKFNRTDVLNCYQAEEPTEDPSCLLERSLPSRDFVREIKNAFEEALQAGCKSIIDPDHGAGTLPLWTVRYWTEMHNALQAQTQWKKGLDWLGEVAEPCFQQQRLTRSHINSLGWNERINPLGTSSMSLAALLAGDMVSTSVVDAIVLELQRRAENNGSYIIADMCFQHEIEKASSIKHFTKVSRGLLRKLEARLLGSSRSLYFPIYISEYQHFVAVRVDFKEKSVSYADGLEGMPKPESTLRKVQWWLKKKFGAMFKDVGNTLAHGIQDDSMSCAIIATNAIAHVALGDPLWTSENMASFRLDIFNQLADAHRRSDGNHVNNQVVIEKQADVPSISRPKRKMPLTIKLRDEANVGEVQLSSHRQAIRTLRQERADVGPKKTKNIFNRRKSVIVSVELASRRRKQPGLIVPPPAAAGTEVRAEPDVPQELDVPDVSDGLSPVEISTVPESVLTMLQMTDELEISEGSVEIDEPTAIKRLMGSNELPLDEVSIVTEPVLTPSPDILEGPAETEGAMPEEPSAPISEISIDINRHLSPVAAALISRLNADLLKMCHQSKSRKVSDFQTLKVVQFATDTRDEWFDKPIVVNGKETNVQMTHIMEVIGYSRPWFTLAKKVAKLAKESGEDIEQLKESYLGITRLEKHFEVE